ncbi:hypothetical protein Ciccas_013414, partial [Cichlidogyrus casuarinus]
HRTDWSKRYTNKQNTFFELSLKRWAMWCLIVYFASLMAFSYMSRHKEKEEKIPLEIFRSIDRVNLPNQPGRILSLKLSELKEKQAKEKKSSLPSE